MKPKIVYNPQTNELGIRYFGKSKDLIFFEPIENEPETVAVKTGRLMNVWVEIENL